MHQLIAWFITIWLFTGLVLTYINSSQENLLKREEKRNLNLIGKEVINCISYDLKGELIIDKQKCFDSIKALPTSENVSVLIFVIDNRIVGITKDSQVTVMAEEDEDTASYVNKVLNKLIYREDIAAKIEIVYNGIEDSFFNELGDDMVIFLVSENEKFLSVSGYSLVLQ